VAAVWGLRDASSAAHFIFRNEESALTEGWFQKEELIRSMELSREIINAQILF
jgi:hypothetical protein